MEDKKFLVQPAAPQPLEGMTYSQMEKKLNDPVTISRKGWPEGYIEKGKRAVIYKVTQGGDRKDYYAPTAEDLAATDWFVVE